MSGKSEVFEKLSERFRDKVLEADLSFGEPVVTIDKSGIHDLLSFLKADKGTLLRYAR